MNSKKIEVFWSYGDSEIFHLDEDSLRQIVKCIDKNGFSNFISTIPGGGRINWNYVRKFEVEHN